MRERLGGILLEPDIYTDEVQVRVLPPGATVSVPVPNSVAPDGLAYMIMGSREQGPLLREH
jgi:hypothetical protein